MRAVVFAGANIENYGFCKAFLKDSIIICCDSGLRHAKQLGIIPTCVVGDFDSVDAETLAFFKVKNVPIKTFPTHKDENDTLLGIEAAMELGATEIVIIGGIGSRMDHTLANCNLLYYTLKKGVKATMVNEKNEIHIVDKAIELYGKKGDLVSLLPLSLEVKGIETQGLEYPLKNGTLSKDCRIIAVSNVMTEEHVKITVKEGYLLVMRCQD